MSGVYIPGMEMPENCLHCGFKINCDDCEGYECFCAALHKKTSVIYTKFLGTFILEIVLSSPSPTTGA